MKRMIAVLIPSMLMVMTSLAAQPAKELSGKEVRILSAKASTPAEHNQLAQYYSLKAEKLEADANDHAVMARKYRANPTVSEVKRPMSPDTAAHCEYYSESLRKSAAEARALADAHTEMGRK